MEVMATTGEKGEL